MPVRLNSLRVLFPSVVLPVLIVASDQALLAMMQGCRWSGPITMGTMGWFVFQTGLLAYLAGRWLPNWGLRLLVLCWAQLLISMLLPQVANDESRWITISHLLTLAFLSGQIGALATWTVLGNSSWWRRLAIWLLAPIPLLFLLRWISGWISGRLSGDPWDLIMMAQAGGTCVLAALLHVCGYRIEPAGSRAQCDIAGPLQFSIRQLLIATTVVAITVPLVQRMLRESPYIGARQWFHATADGVVLAVVSLAAIWADLGAGRWWSKVLAFTLLALAAGASLRWLEKTILHPFGPYSPRWMDRLTDAGFWWLAWTMLAGSFLAANLLVLRATGYRLVRRRR